MPAKSENTDGHHTICSIGNVSEIDTFKLFSADLRNQQSPDGLTPPQALVLENVPLAIAIAAKVYRRGVIIGGFSDAEFPDVVQAGIMGLIRSVGGYDPQRGEFHDFAAPAITGECWKEVEMWMSPIRFPVPARSEMRKAAKVRNMAGNSVSVGVVAQELDVSPGKAKKLIKQLELERVASLEAPVLSSPNCDGDDVILADLIPDPDDIENAMIMREDLRRAWERLADQEQQLLAERFSAEQGEGMKVNEELACRFGVTSRCIRKRQKRAIKKLRSELEALE